MKKARVILLNPPTTVISTEVLLSLTYLAAALRKAGHEVRIVDSTAPFRLYTAHQINRIIAEFNPHFIGVTLTVAYISKTYLYLKELRKMNVPIVAGGPHANCLPEEVLENGADIVCIGERENTIVDLAEYFLGNRPLDKIDGLCVKNENGNFFYTAPRKLTQDLDSIPFPDFGDFPIKNYTESSDVNSNPIFWSIFTSRGCPFDCTFCSSHNVFGRSFRARSARNVFEEIKQLVARFGIKSITFQDDEILCSKKRFLELCDLICSAGLKIRMSMRTRIDSIDKEILLKAKEAGLTRISFGVESWNDDTLQKINKNYTVKTIQEKFKLIEETKFPYVSFNNLCGFPWETPEHFQKNIVEMRKIPKSVSYFTVVTTPIPFPKTKLYETYHKQFGFTNWWWHDRCGYPIDFNHRHNPFFRNYTSEIYPLYIDYSFWDYSLKMRQEINAFSWKVFSLFVRRHYNLFSFCLIVLLCKLSHFIWTGSPSLEKIVFHPLAKSKTLKKFREKIKFVTKY